MPYKLTLESGIAQSIKEYVRQRFDAGTHENAVIEIRSALARLASKPSAVRQPKHAVRPIYRFSFDAGDGITRHIQVTFYYDHDEQGITITSFGIVPM